MNKKYYFRSYASKGTGPFYLIALIIMVITGFILSLFLDYSQPNNVTAGILIAFLVALPIAYFLSARSSYIRISDGDLSFVKNFKKIWSVGVTNIAKIEQPTLSNSAWRKFSANQGLGRNKPRTGVAVTSSRGQTYEAHFYDELENFKYLAENINEVSPRVQIIENQDLLNWQTKNSWSY